MSNALPGEELILQGLEDLAGGKLSAASLLVSIGAARMRDAGLVVPPPFQNAEHQLYELLAQEFGDDAHSRYHGLLRRLVSYERALECVK